MKTRLIDGKKMADEMLDDVREQVSGLPRAPRLAVVLVGDNPASLVYVKNKVKASQRAGIRTDVYRLSPVLTQDALEAFINDLNADGDIDGILLQLPLPAHLNADAAIERIAPDKDVDGLTTHNLGRLMVGAPNLAPCTPLACLHLIKKACPKLAGKNAVIVGRSRLVGRPLGQLLLAHDCTVVQAHSHTKNLAQVCARADILVAAAGHARLIGRRHVKRGAVVIDVGINRVGDRLVGDVNRAAVTGVARAVTPVPGGVGPMTIAMLMYNTLRACRRGEAKSA
ncbi:MAG: bifunctional 5,10-methylenetetrahydrofolate dehydrogenase/5,10-methenyltetrahydrofolate cyclohydrolase [Alphaproteobacteria bacterium]|nr:bifunctional 5,10-methylenetetrahydrofolate dehydrogenase/5,10-methenyltetrahydrofolate cyclohydrolase [Alphaproteobacteria bacterium]